jgi:hypothetical protein
VKVCFATCFFVFFSFGRAFAATLDFDAHPSGIAASPLTFETAAISESSGGALFVYGTGDFGMPARGGVCALQTGFSCTGDVSLLFIGPVSNLSFKGHFASVADRATISVFSGDTLLGFMLVSGNADGRIEIDFGETSGITRVQIENLSGPVGKGIAYGEFDFDVDTPNAPPPPPLPPLALDFDALPRGANEGLVNLGNAVLAETAGERIFVYRTGDFGMPQNGGFCALLADFSCMGDFLLEFDRPITNLIFSGFFAKGTDSVFVSLFDGDLLVFSRQFFGNSAGTITFDFRYVTRLTTILIEDRSDPATRGIAFGDFRYRPYEAPVAPVPVPASFLLLATALALFLRLKRAARRRSAVALPLRSRRQVQSAGVI